LGANENLAQPDPVGRRPIVGAGELELELEV
jgi:hypothetical protein